MTNLPPASGKPRIVIDFDEPLAAASVHTPAPAPPSESLWAQPPAPPARNFGPPPLPVPVPVPVQQQPASHSGATAYASWGQRLGAALIDSLITGTIGVTLYLILMSAAFSSVDSDTGDGLGLAFGVTLIAPVLIFLFATFVYSPVLMSRTGAHNGMTWGKQAMDIRVERMDGRPVTFGTAVLREIVAKGAIGLASAFTFAIVWLVDYLWPLWDAKLQTLHDKMASTVVRRA